jgi:hypothetical protein
MKRPLLIAGLILVVAAGGVLAYAQFRPRPMQPARGDPGIAAAVAVGALLRSEAHRLTAAQITAVLPLLRVVRDTDPNDVEASRALADEIMRIFTPEQRAELTRLREQAQARRAERRGPGSGPGQRRPGSRLGPGGPGSPGGPGGPGFAPEVPGLQGGPGAGMGSRAEFRRRLLDRLIRRLEGSV